MRDRGSALRCARELSKSRRPSTGNLLLVDVGNTSMKVGLLLPMRHEVYSLQTNRSQTSDALGLDLLHLIDHAGADPADFEACVVCSVVPPMEPLFEEAVARFLGCPLLFVPRDIPVPLENRYLRPEQVGADRLVAAYAARVLNPDPAGLVVVDFGTAVTFDCVQGDAYLGGLIFPGPLTALDSLARGTAKLPSVNLDCSASRPVPGRDTVTSIRHGILFGFSAMVEGLVAQLSEQLEGPVACVATGGFAERIARLTPCLTNVVPCLLLQGMEFLYRTREDGPR